MTTAVAGARRMGTANAGLAAAGLAVAVALVAGQAQVRRLEAMTCTNLLNLLGMHAAAFDTAVVFPSHGRPVGFTVAAGCTAALLVVPFIGVAAVLLVANRVRPGRAVATVAVFSLVMSLINQLRLVVIALALRSWGYPVGWDRSHVLLGSLVSTVGVAGGLLVFLRMVVPRRDGPQRG